MIVLGEASLPVSVSPHPETQTMSSPIDFHFDYSSPYGYLASERIEALAARHGREVVWRPLLLGAVFKVTGQRPLTEAPMKGEYALMDFHRSAREHDIAFTQPETFPIGAVAAKRATLWLRDHDDEAMRARTVPLIHALYRAYYRDGRDISPAATVVEIAAGEGIERDALEAALGAQAIKDRLRAEVERAIEKGVFGSPSFIVDGELFWGHDRLEMLDRWLTERW